MTMNDVSSLHCQRSAWQFALVKALKIHLVAARVFFSFFQFSAYILERNEIASVLLRWKWKIVSPTWRKKTCREYQVIYSNQTCKRAYLYIYIPTITRLNNPYLRKLRFTPWSGTTEHRRNSRKEQGIRTLRRESRKSWKTRLRSRSHYYCQHWILRKGPIQSKQFWDVSAPSRSNNTLAIRMCSRSKEVRPEFI